MTHRTIQPLSAVLSDPGEQLTGPTLDLMQSCFAADFRNVRLHRTLASDSANRAIGSFAFTIHEHIGLRAGLDESHGAFFNYVLAHELAHVLQKRLPNTSNRRSFGTVFALEKEAAWAANRVVAGLPVSVCLSDTAQPPRFWGPPGHFYTVYLCSIWANCSIDQALFNAFFAEMPDHVDELDAKAVGKDLVLKRPAFKQQRTDLEIQWGLHALTGANAREETIKRRRILEEDLQMGFALPGVPFALALHAFGDSFAHRKEDNDTCNMYSAPFGHLIPGTSADSIHKRSQLYLNYALQMFDILCAQSGTLSKTDREQRRKDLEKRLCEEVIVEEEEEDQIDAILDICGAKTKQKSVIPSPTPGPRPIPTRTPLPSPLPTPTPIPTPTPSPNPTPQSKTGRETVKFSLDDQECVPWKEFQPKWSRHRELPLPYQLLDGARSLARWWSYD
jgi:hypothetical protein